MESDHFHIIFASLIVFFFSSCSSNLDHIDDQGQRYRIKKYGSEYWLIDNLKSKVDSEGDTLTYYYPDNNPNFEKGFGLLYDYESACRACPVGWHLPTNDEWERLLNFNENNNAKKYKDFKFWRGLNDGNESGFSVVPAGYGNNGSFDNYFMAKAIFTSRTKYDEESISSYIFEKGKNIVRKAPQHEIYGFSVRCVKD